MRIDAYAQVQQLYQTKKVQKAEPAKKGSFSDQLPVSYTHLTLPTKA